MDSQHKHKCLIPPFKHGVLPLNDRAVPIEQQLAKTRKAAADRKTQWQLAKIWILSFHASVLANTVEAGYVSPQFQSVGPDCQDTEGMRVDLPN